MDIDIITVTYSLIKTIVLRYYDLSPINPSRLYLFYI